jgi:hypothetical protein
MIAESLTKKYKSQVPPVSFLEKILLAVVVSIPLWPPYLSIDIKGVPSINITRILIFSLATFWVLGLAINTTYHDRLNRFIKEYRFLLFCIMLPFFMWKLFTVGSSLNYHASTFSALRDTIYYLVIFLVTVNLWISSAQVERAIKILLITSIIIFFITLVEKYLQYNLFSSFVPDSFISAQRLREGLVRSSVYRAWGTFTHPLALGNFCISILPMAVWYISISKSREKILGYVSCLLLLLTLYMSSSRASLFVLIASLWH